MRVLVLETASRQEHAGLDQGFDHGLVGVALLTLVVDDTLANEAGRLIGESAVLIDGVGDGSLDFPPIQPRFVLHPDIEVFATMARRGVHKTSAGIVGDMVAFEKRNDEIISASPKRMRT